MNERKKDHGTAFPAASGTQPVIKSVQRPADLPHYGMLEQKGTGQGRALLNYRLGTYDAVFMRKCAHALAERAEAVVAVYIVEENGAQRDMLPELRASGQRFTEHKAFRGALKGMRLTVRRGGELTAVFTAGSNAIQVEVSASLGRDEIVLYLDEAVHQALRMPDQPAAVPAEEKKAPEVERIGSVQDIKAPVEEKRPPVTERIGSAQVMPEMPREEKRPERSPEPRKGKKLFLLIPAAVVVLALILLIPLASRMIAYSNAAGFEAEGQYASALESYTKAKNYKDAPEKAEEMERAISYENGKTLFGAGSFAEAEQSFLEAGDYADASQWAETSRKAMHYEAGVKALQAENYLLAIDEFTAAGDYSDAPAQLEHSRKGEHYRLGCEAYESGDYALAVEEFTAAGDWEGAAAQLTLAMQGVSYTEGVALMESGNYAEALEKLEAAGDFTGAPERIRQCAYHLGVEAMERKEYSKAYEYLERCDGYSDGKTQLAKVAVILGKEQLQKGAYPAALGYFQTAKSSGSKENSLDDYIALCRAESYFLEGKLQEGVKAFQSISASFWPAEVNIGTLRNDANRLKAFADLEGTYGSETYDIRITGALYTHYYPKGSLKDQSLTITCTLNKDMTVTIKGTVKFYYFDKEPPLYGFGYVDKTKTLSFTVKDQQWVPSVYNIDNQTKIFFGSAPRIDYRALADGRSTSSSVTYDVKE